MIPALIIWSGISAGLLVIVVLIVPQENISISANRYLAGMITCLCINLALRFIAMAEIVNPPAYILGLAINANFFLGPFLLFYIRALTNTGQPNIYHWLPGFIVLAYLLVSHSFTSPEGRVIYLSEIIDGTFEVEWTRRMQLQLPATASILIYTGLGLRLIKQHQLSIGDHFSTLDNINLYWLRSISWILIFASSSLAFESPHDIVQSFWRGFVFVGMIYFTGFMGIRQPAIFRQTDRHEKATAGLNTDDNTDSLNPGDSKSVWNCLLQLFEEEQSYLRPNLNLARLAEQLDVPPTLLSAALKHHGRCNFFDFVNERRVEHAKKLLREQKQLGVLDIGLDSGFNSKSTFYAQFKKYTGMPPSAYRAQSAKDEE